MKVKALFPGAIGPGPEAAAASELLKALASPHRLLIACRLAEGEATVGALAGLLGVRDTVVSQHLSVLRRERIVRAQREGQQVRYALASEAARAVISALANTLCGVPAARNRSTTR